MSYKAKLQKLRKEIRKESLFELFNQKRMNVVKQQSARQNTMKDQVPSLNELEQVSKAAQSQSSIEDLHQRGWLGVLYQFMDSRYSGTKEQQFASAAMCNLLILGDYQPPSQKLTNDLLRLLTSPHVPLLTSILSALFNLIYDHAQWCHNLVFDGPLVELVNRLFQVEGADSFFLHALLRTVALILQRVKPSHKLLIFLDSLLTLSTIVDSSLLYLILRPVYQFCRVMPADSSRKIQQSLLIPRLSVSLKHSNSVPLLQIFLKIVYSVCNDLSCRDFEGIIPIIRAKRTESRTLEVLSYRIIYIALEERLLCPAKFWEDPLKETILAVYQQTEDNDILVELSYICCVCLLNISHQRAAIGKMKNLMSRASSILGDNVEVKGYMEESIQMYDRSS